MSVASWEKARIREKIGSFFVRRLHLRDRRGLCLSLFFSRGMFLYLIGVSGIISHYIGVVSANGGRTGSMTGSKGASCLLTLFVNGGRDAAISAKSITGFGSGVSDGRVPADGRSLSVPDGS